MPFAPVKNMQRTAEEKDENDNEKLHVNTKESDKMEKDSPSTKIKDGRSHSSPAKIKRSSSVTSEWKKYYGLDILKILQRTRHGLFTYRVFVGTGKAENYTGNVIAILLGGSASNEFMKKKIDIHDNFYPEADKAIRSLRGSKVTTVKIKDEQMEFAIFGISPDLSHENSTYSREDKLKSLELSMKEIMAAVDGIRGCKIPRKVIFLDKRNTWRWSSLALEKG